MSYPWGTERRFNAYVDHMRSTFGERLQKVTINAGFTCPNRDGTVGRGGCTFCDNRSFNPSFNASCKPVKEQIENGIKFHKVRYSRVTRYLAYFQAYSNTYADLDDLKRIYQPAIEHPDVAGIVIGTRPDCVDEEKLDYFAELNRKTYVVLEYGIESVFDQTLQDINRGHDFKASEWAIRETAKRGIRTGGHLIIGLPGEGPAHWMETVRVISELPLHNVKFHQLQIIRGTAMAIEFNKHPERFRYFALDEYLQLMADLIEFLTPDIVLERIAGEANPRTTLQKGWGIRYDQVLQRFEEILEERDTWQGKNRSKK
jgi:radical SAM protein (TIGR01212 family)